MPDRNDVQERLMAVEIEQARTDERWQEHWRWKNNADGRLNNLEDTVGTMAEKHAATAAELKEKIQAEVRWSSFYGTIAAGIVVGVVLWIIRLVGTS